MPGASRRSQTSVQSRSHRAKSGSPPSAQARRRVRPPRGRGLRTTTGWSRRIKCDEARPSCSQCIKSDRDCRYVQPQQHQEHQDGQSGSSVRSPSRMGSVRPQSPPSSDIPHEEDHVLETIEFAVPRATASANTNASANATVTVHANETDLPIASPALAVDASRNEEDGLSVPETTQSKGHQLHDPDHHLPLVLSPAAPSQSSLLDISPFEWYDLIARDAISNTQKLHDLLVADPTWIFDEASLSRRQSPIPELCPVEVQPLPVPGGDLQNGHPPQGRRSSVPKSWNTSSNIELSAVDLVLMRHYVEVVGPILDLFDSSKHFTNVVPHLSMRNVGLLKSVLAVAAHHMSLPTGGDRSVLGSSRSLPEGFGSQGLEPRHLATQYYYETLQYLSQTLLQPLYAKSPEILATAMMISTYEMFEADVGEPSRGGNWERHLRGAFWIQRNQENNAESIDGLGRAAWWAWIRQDIWAAFRTGRPTLTLYRPQRTIHDMNSDDLASWAVFLAAKCVEFAAEGRVAIDHQDLRRRIDRGNHLLQCLQEWHDILPESFHPMTSAGESFSSSLQGLAGFTPDSSTTSYSGALPVTGEPCPFPPVWIHPPNHAGGIQMYHFARSLVLLRQPSTGDLVEFRRRQKLLNESLHMICGISNACRENDVAMAFVNCQALYAIGQWVETPEHQAGLAQILKRMLAISKFPSLSLLSDLERMWQDNVG